MLTLITLQSKMQVRISLKAIVDIANRCNEAQKQTVIDIGLGGLLGLKCTRIDHNLCQWVVQNFDPDTCSLTVHGRNLRLTCEEVHVLLGIRAEGDDMQFTGSIDAYTNIYEEVGAIKGVIPLN